MRRKPHDMVGEWMWAIEERERQTFSGCGGSLG